MAIEVELDIFSGRRNPTWTLTPAQERDFRSTLNQLRAETLTGDRATITAPILGYRGLDVRGIDDQALKIFGGIIQHGEKGFRDPRRELERWLLSTAPSQIDGTVLQAAKRDLEPE